MLCPGRFILVESVRRLVTLCQIPMELKNLQPFKGYKGRKIRPQQRPLKESPRILTVLVSTDSDFKAYIVHLPKLLRVFRAYIKTMS